MANRNRNRVQVTYTISQTQKEKIQLFAEQMFDGNNSLALNTIVEAFEVPKTPPSMKWKALTTTKEELDAIGRVKAKRSTELNKQHAKRIREGKKAVE